MDRRLDRDGLENLRSDQRQRLLGGLVRSRAGDDIAAAAASPDRWRRERHETLSVEERRQRWGNGWGQQLYSERSF